MPGWTRSATIDRYDVYGVTLGTTFPFTTPGPVSSARVDVEFEVAAPAARLGLRPETLVDAQGRRDDGASDFAFHDLGERDAVRITGATDFLVSERRIDCRLIDPAHRYLVEIALFGMVFALWLERRGVLTLHASAAVAGGRAVAFAGAKGGGKTSLATACVDAGHALLADDLLALDVDDRGVSARRGWPALRLWPDQLARFVDVRPEDLPLVHPDQAKRRVVVGSHIGRFAGGAAPLQRIYVPERVADGSADVTVSRLPPRDAVIALVRHSFLPREVHRFGLQPPRLRALAQLVHHVPVAALRYPTGLDRLAEVAAAVERDLTDRASVPRIR